MTWIKRLEAKKRRGAQAVSSHPLYGIWAGIIQRCTNPKSSVWAYYGGRGIAVCERWRSSPANFYADMGPRPSSKHSIDRIDNDGGTRRGYLQDFSRATAD